MGSRSGDHFQGPVEHFLGRLVQGSRVSDRGRSQGPQWLGGQKKGLGGEGERRAEELTQEAAKGYGR